MARTTCRTWARRRVRRSTGPRGGTRSARCAVTLWRISTTTSSSSRRTWRSAAASSSAPPTQPKRADVRGGARTPQGRAAHRQVQVDGDRGDRPERRARGRGRRGRSRPTSASTSSSSRGEQPFHIVAPAIHKTLEQIAELFTRRRRRARAGGARRADARRARQLREKFLQRRHGHHRRQLRRRRHAARSCLVTNEGNGRLTSYAAARPRGVMGMERLVPTTARSRGDPQAARPGPATGQQLTVYIDAHHRPAPAGRRRTGPRSCTSCSSTTAGRPLLGRPTRRCLHCIRCGACLDVCPVYRQIGGHAYDSTYSGPIGAVLSPLLEGLSRHVELPFASSLCGACSEVCSAGIPLTEHLLRTAPRRH